MKKLITCLTAGLLVIGAQSLMAQSATNSVNTPGTQTPGQHKEQHLVLLKILGLTHADLKGLTPAERQAKMKTAATNVVAELQAKKANGTLTTKEQADLDIVQKYLAHPGHKKAKTPSDN
jgi:phage I-like protein